MASYDVGVSGGIDVESRKMETFLFAPSWDVVAIDGLGTTPISGDAGVTEQSFDAKPSWSFSAEQGEGGGAGAAVRSVPFLVRTVG